MNRATGTQLFRSAKTSSNPTPPTPHRRTSQIAALLVAVSLLLGHELGALRAATAQRAFDFVRTVGTRIDLQHANYTNNWSAAKSALLDAKIRYVRASGRGLHNDPTRVNLMKQLIVSPYSIDFDLVYGSATETFANMHSAIDTALAEFGTAGIIAFEGPNEWSKHWYKEDIPNWDQWASQVNTFQTELNRYLRVDKNWPSTKRVIAPTMWRRDRWAYGQVNIANACDRGNLHYYHGDKKPTLTGACEGPAKSGGNPSNTFTESMDQAITDMRVMKPGSFWVTETGSATSTGGDIAGTVSPTVAAKYLPRLVAEFFNRGAGKVFLFELIDAADGSYGLLNSNGVRKASYNSVKNMMTLLDDSASTFTPGSISYSGVSGVQSLLLQKTSATGKFYLLLWRDIVSGDNENTTPITLTFGSPVAQVRTATPFSGTGWTTKSGSNNFSLNVPDHIMIVEITK